MIFYVLEGVDLALVTRVIQPGYDALSSFVAAPLRAGMVLLMAVHGFNLMKGHTQGLSAVDVGWLIIKMGLVSELLINWGFFNTWVYGTIWGTYTGLADVLATSLTSAGLSSTLGLSSSALDGAFMSQMESAFLKMVGEPEFVTLSGPKANIPVPIPKIPIVGGWIPAFEIPIPMVFPNLIRNIAGLIEFVMTIVLFASVFVVMLLSRLGLTSCLAVAPIFIALALFQHTRSYTDAWFRGMLGFVLTPALLMVVLLVANASIAVFNAGPPAGWAPLPAAVNLIGPAVAYLILYYALAKSVASIPQFASGLVGSMLSHVGGEAAHSLIGGMHKGIDAGIGAAKGAVKGFALGGPAGAKLGAAKGAAGAMR
ncbi:MAG: type IV secretion system protein [Hydrogenophaga sp.]|nr:type IV secretion system protein [Hydrogenophaga sp.]